MAEIQLVCREYVCNCAQSRICGQCYTDYAPDLGCPYYRKKVYENHGDRRVIGGDECDNADMRYFYVGKSVKNYIMEEVVENGYYYDRYMLVTIRGNEYKCDKVVLDGKCIFNELEEDDESVT